MDTEIASKNIPTKFSKNLNETANSNDKYGIICPIINL